VRPPGLKTAQAYLGILYKRGEGVPQDYVQAHMWFNLAASHENMSGAVELRDEIASKMTPAQIAEAQKLAREWKPKPSLSDK
jgi:TPR repeat protein